MNVRRIPLLLLLLAAAPPLPGAPLSAEDMSAAAGGRPLPPDYGIHADGSVTQRVCFNWSCASHRLLTFTATEMAGVARQMARCPGGGLRDRVQRLRIGVRQMEALAQAHEPLLANDEGLNEVDHGRDGRMDCIDHTSNTTTYLRVLLDLGLLPGWAMAPPRVRDRFSLDVHWTAAVVDARESGTWAVDAWFRPNATLPFVMPIADWERGGAAWEPPFSAWNPTPRHRGEPCDGEPRGLAGTD